MNLGDQLEHGWALFRPVSKTANLVETDPQYQISTEPMSLSPERSIPQNFYSRSSFASMIYNRIAIDVSMIRFEHVVIDKTFENQTIQRDSSLQRIFDVEANIDQTSTDFFHDLTYSLFDEGVVAVVITDATFDPRVTGSYDIKSLRVGKIIQWYPKSVRVRLYNENKGDFSEVIVQKSNTAIIENPLQAIVGSQNPTLDRLLQKLSLLDKQDLDVVTNKLNVVLQLPHPVGSEKKQQVAEKRVKDIEDQLGKSNLGVAYIGAEERITQLNRQINSNLIDEIKYLTDELLNQLGVTRNIFNGTASASEMQNYYTRTIEPITIRIKEEFQRKFITKTAYTQGHRINTYNDPFKLVPTEQLASIGDALLRNSILTPNEFRSVIGYGPNANPMADELYNRNIADSNQNVSLGSAASPEEIQNGDEYLMEEGHEQMEPG